jgi:BMFP domain-containing protein YqiC
LRPVLPHPILLAITRELSMVQTTNRIFDEMAKLMNDAAGVASGVRKEVETIFQAQAERILRNLDVVTREEFEAIKEMAAKARDENERLSTRIGELEKKLRAAPKGGDSSGG